MAVIWASYWICALVGGYWGWTAYRVSRGLRRVATLTPASPGAPPCPPVSAVLPARNEEADLARSVSSLLSQADVEVEVVVVDDGSSDRTPEIADTLARQDPRVRVIHDPPLVPGWLGKQNALAAGVSASSAELLLLCDADVLHRPGVVAAAVTELVRGGYDYLSVFPRLEYRTLTEAILVPFYFSSLARLGDPRLADPSSSAVAAVGAFQLVRRGSLAEIGGLAAVRAILLDDVALAVRLKRRGFRVGVLLAPELLEVRPFKGNRDAFWGTTKSFSSLAQGGTVLLAGNLLLAAAVLAGPPAAFVVGAFVGSPGLCGIAAAVYLFQYLSLLASRRLLTAPAGKLLFIPLAAAVSLACGGRALWLARKGRGEWRGRPVDLLSPAHGKKAES